VLAFLCAFNMVEVHCVSSQSRWFVYDLVITTLFSYLTSFINFCIQALEDPTRKRVKKAIHSSIASCFVLFQVFGLAGYFYAYDACRGNIFLNFGECDYSIDFIKFILRFSALTSSSSYYASHILFFLLMQIRLIHW
jgi:hypothetical protein